MTQAFLALLLAPALSLAATTITTTQTTTSVTQGATATFGSVAFSVVDVAQYGVVLNGTMLPYNTKLGVFVATDLPIQSVPFILIQGGEAVMTATYTPVPGVHQTCAILPKGSGFQTACGDSGTALRRSDIPAGSSTAQTGGLTSTVAAPQAMAESDLGRLLQSVAAESFSSDQIGVIRTAAGSNHFTCDQVLRLLAPLSFGSDKLEALRYLAPRIVDRQNAFAIEAAFTFSSDKDAARALLR